MNIIFLRRKGKARQLNLARPLTLSVVAALTLLVLGGAFALGLQYGLGAHQRGMLSDIPRFGDVLAAQKQQRADPFDGREAFHKGVDFAGAMGDKVVAVAEGVVTWAGERSGFGKLVEISHGDGYVTRYAHNQRTLVAVGQMVKRGESVALMGSTGRSTGPHVHFEVLRNGRQVNPLSFIGH